MFDRWLEKLQQIVKVQWVCPPPDKLLTKLDTETLLIHKSQFQWDFFFAVVILSEF